MIERLCSGDPLFVNDHLHHEDGHDHIDVCDHADNRDHPSYIWIKYMDAGANIIVWSVWAPAVREVKAAGASCTSRQSAGRPFLLCWFYSISVNILRDLFQIHWWICNKSGFIKSEHLLLLLQWKFPEPEVSLQLDFWWCSSNALFWWISGDAYEEMLGVGGI